MKFWKHIVFAPAIFAWSGCAHLATVRTTQARVRTITANEERLARAQQQLAAAEQAQPVAALCADLSAAKISLGALEREPNNSVAQKLYNFSVARAVENVGRANLRPWRQPASVFVDNTKYVLSTPHDVDPEHDPDRYDLIPTDTLKISGKFFKNYSTVRGIGAPLVAVGRAQTPNFRQHFKYRRVYAPVTAIVRFSGRQALLEFIDPYKSEKVTLSNRVFSLAADFDAPGALLIAHERPDRLGFSRLMNPGAYADTAMLCQLQQFDPARTPVIFVHGLQETGASWAPMIDTLRDDPWIRKHYQFWFFSYPSGYPYPYSAALFRQNLDGVDRMFPNHKHIILIGHSMGGMICRLMITDAGDKIWRAFFGTSPGKTPMAPDTRKFLETAFVFQHRPEVERVIFISTPHRGSKLASDWIGRIGAGFVKTPAPFAATYASIKPLLITDSAARSLDRMPNSVDTLEPNDRFVEAVNKLPITRGIPYHSIMGDRGRGDTPNSSDGIVPYWSSHLDGAQSELVVNSGHGAQYNPRAIAEVERILRVNLGRLDRPASAPARVPKS